MNARKTKADLEFLNNIQAIIIQNLRATKKDQTRFIKELMADDLHLRAKISTLQDALDQYQVIAENEDDDL